MPARLYLRSTPRKPCFCGVGSVACRVPDWFVSPALQVAGKGLLDLVGIETGNGIDSGF